MDRWFTPRGQRRGATATAALAFLVGALSSGTARADIDHGYGARLGIGGGAAIAPGDARGGLFELAPRGEVLFGDGLAIGPAVEFRTATFQTAELAGGLTGAIPLGDSETGLLASIGGGYAWRKDEPNGAILTTSIAWGLYRLKWKWAASTTLYVSFRHAITGPSRDELTAGISLGGGIWNMLLRMVRM